MRLFRPASRLGLAKNNPGVYWLPKLSSEWTLSKNSRPSLKWANVTPWSQAAPHSDSAASSISKMESHTKRRAYIALGSNLGNRIEMIESACNEMSKRGIRVKRTSSLWETEPMYVLDQNKFVNGACEVGLAHSLVFGPLNSHYDSALIA